MKKYRYDFYFLMFTTVSFIVFKYVLSYSELSYLDLALVYLCVFVARLIWPGAK